MDRGERLLAAAHAHAAGGAYETCPLQPLARFSLDHSLFAIQQAGLSCPAGRLVREVCLFGINSTESNTSSNFDKGGCGGASAQPRAEGRKPGFCPGKRDAHPRVSATGLIASLYPRPVDRRESSVASGIPVSVSQHDEKLHLGSWRSWSATGWRCTPWSRCRCWARGSARAKGHAHQVTGVERTARGR